MRGRTDTSGAGEGADSGPCRPNSPRDWGLVVRALIHVLCFLLSSTPSDTARRNYIGAIEVTTTLLQTLTLARQHDDPSIAYSTYMQVVNGLADFLYGFITRIAAANLTRGNWVRAGTLIVRCLCGASLKLGSALPESAPVPWFPSPSPSPSPRQVSDVIRRRREERGFAKFLPAAESSGYSNAPGSSFFGGSFGLSGGGTSAGPDTGAWPFLDGLFDTQVPSCPGGESAFAFPPRSVGSGLRAMTSGEASPRGFLRGSGSGQPRISCGNGGGSGPPFFNDHQQRSTHDSPGMQAVWMVLNASLNQSRCFAEELRAPGADPPAAAPAAASQSWQQPGPGRW